MKKRSKILFYLVTTVFLFSSFAFSCTKEEEEELATITDYDGNVYHIQKIGNQQWLVENLKVTHYRNGDVIPNVSSNSAWELLAETKQGACCDYGNSSTNSITYGKLYNFFAVNDNRGLAPTGWHVATDGDWTILTTYLGGEGVAGEKLKETGYSHWKSPNTGATNSSGFTALPGGYRWFSGVYDYITMGGVWWTSTNISDVDAYTRYLDYGASDCMRDLNNLRHGASVRCVRN